MNAPKINWSMPIVCTDRGQHERTRLARFDRQADGERWLWGEYRSLIPPIAADDERAQDEPKLFSQYSYSFCCMKCGRTPRVNAERFVDLYVRRAYNAGLAELDVSWLPL